jgi:hypothetical protein
MKKAHHSEFSQEVSEIEMRRKKPLEMVVLFI